MQHVFKGIAAYLEQQHQETTFRHHTAAIRTTKCNTTATCCTRPQRSKDVHVNPNTQLCKFKGQTHGEHTPCICKVLHSTQSQAHFQRRKLAPVHGTYVACAGSWIRSPSLHPCVFARHRGSMAAQTNTHTHTNRSSQPNAKLST